MMNRQQYLLGKLAEEASEIAQIALKCQQFGANETQPGRHETNAQRTHGELDDLMAIVSMLNTEFGFNYDPSVPRMDAKVAKVNHYFEYSVSIGECEPSTAGVTA